MVPGGDGLKRPLAVITTHLNADFDAVSSCLAAKKLHPEALIVLPGSVEKDIRGFLSIHPAIEREFFTLRSVDLAQCKHLIVVDANQKKRMGALSRLLDDEDVFCTLYDHHPKGKGAIDADEVIHKEVGANTTILIALLREKGIDITPEEATFFALGIYEDTGSFQFGTTTPDDLKEAAWLLEKGASLKEIYRFMASRFTPKHVELLNDLVGSAQRFNFRGIPICIAKTSHYDYVEDFSIVVHEFMDMERLPVLFVVALLGDQVVIIGRSREKAVDCGKILKGLGGGGHSEAGSATMRGVTLIEAEEMLMRELQRSLGVELKVSDIMSTPVLYCYPNTSIREAHDALTRYGITVLAVLDKDARCLGLISRRTVEKAIYHGLQELPVSEYMTTDFKTVGPNDTLTRVLDIIVHERQRFLPVVQEGRCVGVITRTDLLQILTDDALARTEPLYQSKEQKRHVNSLMKERLPSWLLDRLKRLGELGEGLGMGVFVVGGFVRDLFLREKNLDVDIVIEGDGILFAKAIRDRFGAKVRAHEKFKTAKVIFKDGFKCDVATARLEYYEYPAAMPTVSLSSLKLDLYRRDFTINTLAIKLNPKEFGLLIDFFGGLRDIKDRCIRVLHSLSFVEDPTRVFRAVRFETRFGFRIGKHTLRLIKNARRLNVFEKLSGKRLFTELKLILEDPDPETSLVRLKELDLLEVIHKDLDFNPDKKRLFSSANGVLAWYGLLFRPVKPRRWLVFMLCLTYHMDEGASHRLCERLDLTGKNEALLTTEKFKALEAMRMIKTKTVQRPSEIYRLLSELELEHQLFIMCLDDGEEVRLAVSRFITELQDKRPILTGDDLKSLGIPPGPVYKKILQRLLHARLDGEVNTRADEVELVRREFL